MRCIIEYKDNLCVRTFKDKNKKHAQLYFYDNEEY